jgi:N-glycosylase/DNA lyase
VTSGQVFRFRESAPDKWVGVDGDAWFVIEGASVESNHDEPHFQRLFNLADGPDEVEKALSDRGPELIPFIAAAPGLRLMRPQCAEETFFSFLCTPNNNLSRIGGMVQTLASYGEMVAEIEGIPVHRFPCAAIIAKIPEAQLRERKFGYRAGTIVRAAHQLVGRGDNWLEELASADYLSAHAELASIDGIGPKLADCIALFALHHGEAVPIDTHLWQQVVRLYRPEWAGTSLTASKYREAGDIIRDRFGSLAGWAQQFLFFDNLMNWRTRRQ